MKQLILSVSLSVGLACAQGALPWGQALSAPALVTRQTAGLFYVSDYRSNGRHTDYDMARQAADSYAEANPWTGSILVLKPSVNETCDAAPLPSVGTSTGKWSTTSVIGYGSGLSSILKLTKCAASPATFSHPNSPNGQLSRGWYQGFTVDANHLDAAACNIYGMSLTTFLDVGCGNAVAGADHELEFGNRDPNSVGWMDNIYVYNLRTFDYVGVGNGGVLTPVWTHGALTGLTVTNPGTKKYTAQYTRATIIGPDLGTCSKVPEVKLIVSNTATIVFSGTVTVNYGYLTGAKIINAGSCGSTAHLYILIQDGTPVTYGMKFSNMADSHVWNLEATGANTYGIAWLLGSSNNSIYGEHPYTNQTFQILDYANGNEHINTFFDSPGAYGAVIYGQNGSFQNATFSWNGKSYLGSAGYYFNGNLGVYQNWDISNSQCTNSTSNFVSITTKLGPLPDTLPAPAGIKLRDIEACDGSNMVNWPSAR